MKNYWLDRKKPAQTLNARFLHEARECEKRWGKMGLLENLPDRYIRGSTAVLLESHRLINER